MKIRIKQWLAILLITCLMLHTTISVNAAQKKDESVVYVNGIAFANTVDEAGNVHIESIEKNYGFSMDIHVDGSATATAINEDGDKETYDLVIKTLTPDEIDVDVYNKSGGLVRSYKSIDELTNGYQGQAMAISASACVFGYGFWVLIKVIAFVVVFGVVCYAATTVYNRLSRMNRDRKNGYYPAYLVGGSVYIALYRKISSSAASNRIRFGQSIYTLYRSNAKSVVKKAYRGVIGPEIDSYRRRGKLYFYHFHTADRNGAHAWYGMPYTGRY